MDSRSTTVITVEDVTHVGEVRRAGAKLSAFLALSDSQQGNLSIVLNELSRNLVLHAGGGEIVLQPSDLGLDVLAIDRGPGMVDVGRCLEDGYSTSGTRGEGLGAVRRLCDHFECASTPGKGTVIFCRFRKSAHDAATFSRTAAVCTPMPGESISGDSWAAVHDNGRTAVLVADGLGHGLHAADASREAVTTFLSSPSRSPAEHLESIHGALRKTRGAAVSVAVIDREGQSITYAGVGNIASAIRSRDGAVKRLVSYNGIIGHQVRKIREERVPWPEGALLIMHSDGVGSSWQLDDYRPLLGRDPLLVAGVLYRDFRRGRDDATVAISR